MLHERTSRIRCGFGQANAKRSRCAVSLQGRSQISVLDLIGLVQFLQAQTENLKDVDRLNYMGSFCKPKGIQQVQVIYRCGPIELIIGSGPHLRAALDEGIESTKFKKWKGV